MSTTAIASVGNDQNPLPPGEYAVVEYTLGKMNMQIWDFQIKPK